MADTPEADGSDDAGALTAAYSRFYVANPAHALNIQTKSHVDAPEIRADFNRAAAGADVVSNLEMSTLSGHATHVYRSDPLSTAKVNAGPETTALLDFLDEKIRSEAVQKGQWGAKQTAEEDQLIANMVKATRLDADQIRSMADNYEQGMTAVHQDRADNFAPMDPKTPQAERSALGAILVRQALGQEVTPEQQQQLSDGLTKLAADNNINRGGLAHYLAGFKENALKIFADERDKVAGLFSEEAQMRSNSLGEAFQSGQPSKEINHVIVPQITGADSKAAFAAWMVNPADLPSHAPPGPPELGTFLISLHESEHLSRQGDVIARADITGKNGLTGDAPEQANEIDADKAVMKYLDDQHEPAAKAYYLQAREVNSFTFGVIGGTKGHDTATFLRVLDKTGQQLDLDAFNQEKAGLFDRLKEKAAFTDVGRGQAKTGDVMGAVQDVLADDRAQKDPAKKLSPMQLAEAQSFLRDATAMGYTANPNYPRPPAQPAAPAAAPAQAAPARNTPSAA